MVICSANFTFEMTRNGAQIISANEYWNYPGSLWYAIDTDGTILWDEGR